MDNIKIKDMYLGKIDGYNEFLEYGQDTCKELFFEFPNISISKLLDGSTYYVFGNKGTGKTSEGWVLFPTSSTQSKDSLRWAKNHRRLFFHICIINIHTFYTQYLHSCFVCHRSCSCQQSTASLQEILNSALSFEYPNTRAKSSFLPVFAPHTFFYVPLFVISANARTEIRKQSPNFV